MRSEVPTTRHMVFGGATVAFAIALGVTVIRVGVHRTLGSRAYTEEPLYAIWGGLVLFQVVIWAIVGAASSWWWKLIRRCQPQDARRRSALFSEWAITAVGLLAPRLAMPLAYDRGYPDDLDLRVGVLGAFAALTMSVPIVALRAVRRTAAEMPVDNVTNIAQFKFLWQCQRNLLSALGLGLAASVLTTAAKIQANNAFTTPSAPALPNIPSSFVLVVGAIYGGIVLIAYLPAHVTMRRAGQLLTGHVAGITAATEPDDWLAAAQRQAQFAALLGLDEGIGEQVRRAAGLLAPLLAALVTTLLPDVKL